MNERKQIGAKRFFGLDFLRVLAVSMILFSHTSWIYNSNGVLGKLQDMSGFLGIELFIVLSGFLIGGMLYKQFLHEEYTLKDGSLFIYRRLMRLLPSYYLVIIINAVVFTAYGFSIAGIWKYFLLLQNFASPVSPFFPESWSLPVKEMGYIFAVFLLFFISHVFVKTSKRFLFLSVIIGLIAVVFLLKMYYNIHSTNVDLKLWSFQVRSVVVYRMDSVLIGVLFGYFYQNYKDFMLSKRWLFVASGILLFLMLIICIVLFRFTLSNAGWFWNLICLPTVSLAICMFIPFLLNLESPSESIGNGIRFICKISYSVYLLHYSFILFLLKNFIDTSNYNIWQLNIFTLFYLLVTVGVSYLLYNYFEKPINEYRHKKLKLDGN
ncbi:acyltransferase family protein [Flavobacterium wongokense]|uniref:acyltransferase family protein n=1 Tax=Flavobacterium wongokense TaxID=2910674 RepID=UPI001F2EBCBA|nr:acyltransferase [Flavobacterium sp. WG47]MCF6130800.1 acyltransferase [Flavobacterium sp. WG47]